MKTIIAIDPGKSNGGVAWIQNGQVYASDMPSGVAEIEDFLDRMKTEDPFVFLEKVNAFMGDASERGKSFRIDKLVEHSVMIQTLLKVKKIPFVLVPAMTWQSTLSLIRRAKNGEPKETKTEKKNRHKELAQKYYPRIKVKHATADALLILTFGKIKWDSDQKWIRDRMPKPIAEKLAI